MDQGDGKEPPLVGYAGTAGKWSMTPIERQESGDRDRSGDPDRSRDRSAPQDLEMSAVGDSSGPDRRDRSHRASKRRKKKKKHTKENKNGEVNQAYDNDDNRNSSELPEDIPEPLPNHRTPHALPPIQPHGAPSPRQPFPGRPARREDVIVPIDVEELQSRRDVADGGSGGILGSLGSLLGFRGGEENSPGTHLDKTISALGFGVLLCDGELSITAAATVPFSVCCIRGDSIQQTNCGTDQLRTADFTASLRILCVVRARFGGMFLHNRGEKTDNSSWNFVKLKTEKFEKQTHQTVCRAAVTRQFAEPL
ncbi:Transient receptor putative cation channel sub M member 2 [Branchiostoma belcheri]|nr:Transient receptor putative cation channel sub M member 2 [Branchiostoma belcheri]